MKRIFYWALGIIILLAVFLAAILGREISLTSFTGSKASEESSTEPDPISITLWSDQAELFLEYPSLVVGHASTFAAHLTDLRTFRPVITGSVEIRMTTTGQPALTFLASTPLRAGIFTPSVTMPEPGTYNMELALMSDSLNETFHIPNVQVLSSKAEVEHQTQQEPLGLQEEVTFLKEQQWKVAFGTKVATNQFLVSTITAR